MEEYMESELSGIFRVKLVTKNIVRGFPATQFMHMRVKLMIMLIGYLNEAIQMLMNLKVIIMERCKRPFIMEDCTLKNMDGCLKY